MVSKPNQQTVHGETGRLLQWYDWAKVTVSARALANLTSLMMAQI